MVREQKTYQIAVIRGDGIGPEIIDAALPVLDAVGERFGFEIRRTDCLAGGAALDVHGVPLPAETVESCLASDAVLLGAVGGPKWDAVPTAIRPEKALLGLRQALGLYVNLRPARLYEALAGASPLHPDIVRRGIDMVFARELTGGIYFGERGRSGEGPALAGYDTERYAVYEIERIARAAFEIARLRRKKVTSVDKANVLESSRLWRETVDRLAADYPDVELEHLYVDNAAMQLVKRPSDFDVVLTTNMFGDILSDEAAMITGSIGILPSASLGEPGQPGLFEPIHGSAPDLAGRGVANPLATILSAAMLLRYGLNETAAADAVENAVQTVLETGWRCADLMLPGQPADAERVLGTDAMADRVIAVLTKFNQD